MTGFHLLGLLWSVVVETAWIWGPALVIGFLLGCAWNDCPCAQASIEPVEQDVNGVRVEGP